MLTTGYWNRERLHVEQAELERDMHDCGVARFQRAQQRAIESGDASATSYNTRLMREFVHPMAQGIQAYLDHYDGKPGRSTKALQHLRLTDPLQGAFIGIKSLFEAVHTGESIQSVAIRMGRKYEDQIRFAKLEDTAPRYVQRIRESLRKAHSKSYQHQRNVLANTEGKVADEVRPEYVNDLSRWVDWPKKDQLGLGLLLIEIAEKSLAYDDQPVFLRIQETRRSPYRIELGPTIKAWINQYSDFMSHLHPDYMPCVVPPRDWEGPKRGGYFTREIARTLPFVKVRRRKHLDLLTRQQMPEVYEAANALQRVPWKINQAVLAVAERIQARDLALGMPQREPFEPELAPVPAEFRGLRGPELREALTDAQLADFKRWKAETREVYRKERKRCAQVDEVRRVLAQAKRFSIYPALYFVYTLDSRGRVYCRSSLVGPQGGDMQKAMVHFAKALPLGDRGRYWLAVHGAGVWGNDKVSFDERVQFIEEDMRETIKDIVADPLTFRDWTTADKPWQFLAWCYEWSDMLDHVADGKPASAFESRIPVAMDGSCSGIQHYSAMLRDRRGGTSVNLCDSEKPNDVYGDVASVVREVLASIADGSREMSITSGKKEVCSSKLRRMAQAWLDFGVDRKLCKKPVMTLPLTP